MFASPFKDGVIVLIILLLFFGPKRLPALSRAIGESVKEFKGGVTEGSQPEPQNTEIPAAAPSEPTTVGSKTTNA
ncbi:MAG TPA: twin-arginine translocase TatA/TatE family subunit [Solirubrobacteraceae bacterium]|nr:twin-arginine translocase TatA/TatE family subunit [Solirubrobacteraceae bacterium]